MGKTDQDLLHPSIDQLLNLRCLQMELARIDVLIHREIARWQAAGQDPLDDFRGLYVSDAMAQALIARPFGSNWGDAVRLPQEQESHFMAALELAIQGAKQVEQEARQNSVDLRLPRLSQIFDLDEFERDSLLICLAPALDLRYERLYGYLQDDVTAKRPTVNLALNLLCRSSSERLLRMRCFQAGSPLIKYNLITRAAEPGHGMHSLLSQAYAVDEAVLSWLMGDYQLPALLRDHACYELPAPGMDEEILAGPARGQLDTLGDLENQRAGSTVLAFFGVDLAGQEAAARLLAARMDRPLLSIELAGASAEASTLPLILHQALRDAQMTGALLYMKNWEVGFVDGAPPLELLERLAHSSVLTIVSSRNPWTPGESPRPERLIGLEFPVPDYARRQECWRHFLASPDARLEPGLDVLAGQFLLTGGQIRAAVAAARDLAFQEHSPLQAEHLFAAARLSSNRRLSGLARKIPPRYAWEDIILPDDQRELLNEIIATMRQRSRVLGDWGLGRKLAASAGVTVLFAGPPGTGKTMAAEVIAGELGIDLYKIDLSTIISKYIGETEKNLEHIFSEAASSNAILFFDEADALFGKRSEVRDSHDRYANIEISYLLQRMEAYEGMTILATNLRANLDEAFTRRLQFSVDFPFPDEADRLRIWLALLPPGLPRDPDLDFHALAQRYKLAGGNIRNILVSAAYLAAADGGKVTMNHLLHGTRRELQKMGKMITDGKLREMEEHG